MRSNKKASFYFFTAAMVLVPAAAITACGDDDTTTGPTTLLDGSAGDARTTSDGQVKPNDSGGGTDSPITPIDSGKDVNQPVLDAGPDADASTTPDADSGPVDAGPDADASDAADADAGTKPTSIANGKYKVTAWTCTHAGGPKDILATANGLGITEIDETINGAVGQVDVVYSANCARTTAFALTYPQAGTASTTTNAAFTCTATCAPATCTSGTQAVTSSTFDYTTTSTTFTSVRTLDAAGVNGLPSAAGCTVGDVESATYTEVP